jgi:hypothetical protein
MQPTLLVLAAGMGTRYGGLKQLDPFGPGGETLMDYAVYDALAAGFGRVVFVIRRDFEPTFRAGVGSRYESRVAVDYAFQELADLPSGCRPTPGRGKPWGTAHAIWCARGCVHEPFVSINADDYYGKRAFRAVAEHLRRPAAAQAVPEYCLVGYPVLATLSEHGAVARALCDIDENGFLRGLVERTRIERHGATGRYVDEAGNAHALEGNEVVSMNMLGFSPPVFAQLEQHLVRFLDGQQRAPDDSECLIPVVVDQILKEKAARMRVLRTTDTWFGVTHLSDKPKAMARIREMVERGDYPSPIWNDG